MSYFLQTMPENPLSAIQRLAGQNGPLILTSTYKGLLLNQEIKILELHEDKLVLQAPGNRICVSLKGHTYLYSPSLPEIITAKIDDLNIEQGRITLYDLHFTGNAWKERFHERIQPMKPIYVDVQCRKSRFRADLDNLSMNGLRLIGYKLSEKGIDIETESNVRLSFTLPINQVRIDLKGTIIHRWQLGKLAKFGVRIFPNSTQAAYLRLYIGARMAEILDELDQQCSEAHEPINAPYMFF